jgi:hypothetical protein
MPWTAMTAAFLFCAGARLCMYRIMISGTSYAYTGNAKISRPVVDAYRPFSTFRRLTRYPLSSSFFLIIDAARNVLPVPEK